MYVCIRRQTCFSWNHAGDGESVCTRVLTAILPGTSRDTNGSTLPNLVHTASSEGCMAQTTQSRPYYGLGFQVNLNKPFQVVPSLLGVRHLVKSFRSCRSFISSPDWTLKFMVRRHKFIKVLSRCSPSACGARIGKLPNSSTTL